MPWRLPAWPCLILPFAVNLKRFLALDLVFILGILRLLLRRRLGFLGRVAFVNRHGMPLRRAVRIRRAVIREAGRFASARAERQTEAMKIPRPLLHGLRLADRILFVPALLLVIWGELTGNQPAFLDFLQDANDKLLHFIAYFGLAAMAAAALKSRRAVVLAGFALIALGAVLEIVQGFTGRDMSLFDELANTMGVVVGSIAARAIVEPLLRRLD